MRNRKCGRMITMNKSQLLPLLKEASKYVPKKNSRGETHIPILACAKINSNNGILTVEVTDLEKYFIGTIKSDIPDMDFLIDIRWFRDIINVMDKDQNIEFKLSDFTKIYSIESTVIGKEKHMTNYESIENHEYETDIINHKPITEKEDYPSLVISQGNSKFMFYINGKGEFELTEFPISFDKINLKYKIKNIDGKNFTGMLYTYVNEDDLDYCERDREEKDKANKLFPKYLIIDGLVASKSKIQSDWKTNKYYCDYSNDTDNRVFIDEIENYEVVGKKVK